MSLPALDRHKRHFPDKIVRAQQAEVVSEATSLLSRVENLMQESEKIAAAAKLEKNWPAATSALREARSCLELLGKLRGDMKVAAMRSIANRRKRKLAFSSTDAIFKSTSTQGGFFSTVQYWQQVELSGLRFWKWKAKPRLRVSAKAILP